MDEYNFKVIAKLRDDLTEEQRRFALSYIEKFQKKLKIQKLDEQTYCKELPIKGLSDFGGVTLFYSTLEDIKEYFSRLEYYDIPEGDSHVAV